MNFLDKHSQEQALRSAFPAFDTFTPEEREELRKAWTRKDRITLVQQFGLDSDQSNADNNSRVSPR